MTNAVAIAQYGSTSPNKNRIINGAMVIDQRNAGASVSGTTGVYTVDRWTVQNNSGAARFNVQQNVNSVTPPAGFKYYLGVTSTSAYSVATGDVIGVQQFIEGYNIADLAWGTSSASPVTLSFWVRSSLTGTFGGSLAESNAATAFYPFSYTISSANTWEQKTITVAGPTIGTWAYTNTRGTQVLFSLGTGSSYTGTAGSWSVNSYYAPTGATNLVGTNNATFYITGVQLEAGTTASPFEYRQYTNEFTLCQRYYYKISVQGGASSTPFALCYTRSSSGVRPFVTFPTPMRVRPTSVETSGTASDYTVYYAGDAAATCTSVPDFDVSSNLTAILGAVVSGTPFPSGGITYLRSASTSAYLGFSAEL